MAIQRTEFSPGSPGKNLRGECCPRCSEEDNLDYDQAPDEAVCHNCGLHFRLVTVAVWDDNQPVVPSRALQDCLPEDKCLTS